MIEHDNSTYQNRGCRCLACREHHNTVQRAYRREQRRLALLGKQVEALVKKGQSHD